MRLAERRLTRVACSCLLVACGIAVSGQTVPPRGPNRAAGQASERVQLTTTDGVRLVATFYPATSSPSQVLLLLHAAYEDRSSWSAFAAAAQKSGFAVLAVDLRGHGESSGERAFTPAMDGDVDAALGWLASSERAKNGTIGIIGASVGANLALRAGVRHREVGAVALLSPGTLLWEIGIDDAVVRYGRRPLFMVAAEDDGYAAGTVRGLSKASRGPCRCDLLTGKRHGVRLFEDHPELLGDLLDWFRDSLR